MARQMFGDVGPAISVLPAGYMEAATAGNQMIAQGIIQGVSGIMQGVQTYKARQEEKKLNDSADAFLAGYLKNNKGAADALGVDVNSPDFMKQVAAGRKAIGAGNVLQLGEAVKAQEARGLAKAEADTIAKADAERERKAQETLSTAIAAGTPVPKAYADYAAAGGKKFKPSDAKALVPEKEEPEAEFKTADEAIAAANKAAGESGSYQVYKSRGGWGFSISKGSKKDEVDDPYPDVKPGFPVPEAGDDNYIYFKTGPGRYQLRPRNAQPFPFGILGAGVPKQ